MHTSRRRFIAGIMRGATYVAAAKASVILMPQTRPIARVNYRHNILRDIEFVELKYPPYRFNALKWSGEVIKRLEPRLASSSAVEPRTVNALVAGSIPALPATPFT